MRDRRRIIKVFLGSPGDMDDERQAAFDVVQEINKNHADFWECHVELIGWEDTLSRFGRPQELINQDLDQCEYFIGMIWKKWGTPPDHEGKFTSGFEEEFTRSRKRREREGKPEITLLFKNVPPDSVADPGKDLTKVLNFRDDIIAGQKVLFQTFPDLQNFKTKIRRLITDYVQRQIRPDNLDEQAMGKGPKSQDLQSQPASDDDQQLPLIPPSSAKFLAEIVQKPYTWDALNPSEVARFRLIAASNSRSGNDNAPLGVHDSNILFRYRNDIDFSASDIDGLIKSGLENYRWNNVPLWHWLDTSEAEIISKLVFKSVFSAEAQQAGSVAALTLLKGAITEISEQFAREDIVSDWLSDSSKQPLKLAALQYLGECGLTGDTALIEPLLSHEDYSVKRNAANAILNIVCRDGREAAIQKLNDIQPDSVDDALLDRQFGQPEALKTTVLKNCLSHRNNGVRFKAVQALCVRKQLDAETSKKLTSDTKAEIRFLALMQLVEHGEAFSDDEARKMLVKTKPSQGLGSLIAGPQQTDYEGEAFWNRFRQMRLEKLPEADLLKECEASSIYDWLPELALYEAFPRKHLGRLRDNLADCFQAAIEKKFAALTERHGDESSLVASANQLKDFLRTRVVKAALDIFCPRASAADLEIIRSVLVSDSKLYAT